MTTTTVEYWSVLDDAGTEYPLQTYAKNIETWGDDRQGVVPYRGSDTKIPHVPGEREEYRVPDARTIGLGMWVKGSDDNNAVPTTGYQQFRQNWRQLQRILTNQGRIFRLRKRFYDEAYTLRIAEARVRFESGMTPSMIGQKSARFTVDLRLADPFFYETTPTTLAIDTAVTSTYSFQVNGDHRPRKIIFTGQAGAAGATAIGFTCPLSGSTWALDGTLNAGDSIMIDFAQQICRINGINRTAGVHHTGSLDWLRFNTGTMLLNSDCTAGTFSGSFTFSSVWN